MPNPRQLFALGLLAFGGLAFAACGETSGPAVLTEGSETHFLTACDQGCAQGSTCLCGVCSKSCGDDATCSAFGEDAACVELAPRVDAGRCAPENTLGMCDVACLVEADCAVLGDGYRCEQGYCRSGAVEPPSLDPVACMGRIVGSDVVVIGDALIELSVFTADLEGEAVSAGALAQGDHFRSYASSLMSILASGSLSISNQWRAARADGAARVVVMDGGATDVLNLPCGDDPSPDCPALAAAVDGAETLLRAMAAASVQDVIYFFYADPPDNPPLKASLDLLRPLIENACGRSQVACHFVDLRSPFAGHPEYVNADVVFLDPGAAVAATAIWDVMEQSCVGR